MTRTRTLTAGITIGAATLACVALTGLAGAGTPLASVGPFYPPETQLLAAAAPVAAPVVPVNPGVGPPSSLAPVRPVNPGNPPPRGQ
jgi:hypothetical protein